MVASSVRARRPRRVSRPLLNYGDFLEARLDDESKRKGERTRDRLKLATIRLLEQVGYRDLRVTDINETAGVSNALFYVYFTNKEEIAQDVLTSFLAYFAGFTGPPEIWESPDQSIYHGNLQYIRMFKANAGLMRCLFQFSDAFPDFAALWGDWNRQWRDRVFHSLDRSNTALPEPDELRFAVAALGAMVDGVLRMVLVQKDPSLTEAELKLDPEALALFLTRLWVRSLFARELDLSPRGAPESDAP